MNDQLIGVPDPATTEAVIEGRPWWKVCCLGCLAMAVLTVAVSILGFRLLSGGSASQTLRSLPESFPKEVVLFRPEENDGIVFYPASTKNKYFNVIIQPLKLFGQDGDELSHLLDTGLKDVKNTDTVVVHWSNLNATADDVIRFYAGAMKQAGVGDPQMKQTSDASIREMIGFTSGLSLKMLLIDRSETASIDSVTFVVEYPSLP